MTVFNRFGISPLAALAAAAVLALSGCQYLKEAISDEDQPVVLKTDMSLAEVVARMEKATDRKGLFEKCTSYTIEQEMICKQEGREACFMVKTIFKQPDNLKTVTYRDCKPAYIMLYNGKKAWSITEHGVKPIDGLMFDFTKEMADIVHPNKTLLDVFAKIDLQLIREDTKEYYKLTCHPKLKDMPPVIMYVGKDNFLTKKVSTTLNFGNKPYTYESTVDRYATTDYPGVLVAEKTTITSNGVTQIFTLKEFKLNVPIPDSEFAPPDWYNERKNPMQALQDAQKYKSEPDKYENKLPKPKPLNVLD